MVDLVMTQWARIRPDLDPLGMRTSGRLLRLAKLVEKRTEAVLRPFGLTIWKFDVLATLRRHGCDLSPGELMAATMLSSGAMTNRLDRLEADGLISRRPDPSDRRGVRVELSGTGRELVDRVIEARFAEALSIESSLEPDEAEELARLLAKMERGLAELQPVEGQVSRRLSRAGPGQRVEPDPRPT